MIEIKKPKIKSTEEQSAIRKKMKKNLTFGFILPQDLHDKIREECFNTKISMAKVVIKALDFYFVDKEREQIKK